MEASELKPCPFCGANATLARDHQSVMLTRGEPATDDHYKWSITHICPSGLTLSIHFRDRAQAITVWNTRAPDEQAKAAWIAEDRRGRTFTVSELDKARAAGIAEGREQAAVIIQRRMDERFEEHGTREYDTNACYYEGSAGETYEALDEEAEELMGAIRKGPDHAE